MLNYNGCICWLSQNKAVLSLRLAPVKGVRPAQFIATDYRNTITTAALQQSGVVLIDSGSRIKSALPGGAGLKHHLSPYPTDTSWAQAIYYF